MRYEGTAYTMPSFEVGGGSKIKVSGRCKYDLDNPNADIYQRGRSNDGVLEKAKSLVV